MRCKRLLLENQYRSMYHSHFGMRRMSYGIRYPTLMQSRWRRQVIYHQALFILIFNQSSWVSRSQYQMTPWSQSKQERYRTAFQKNMHSKLWRSTSDGLTLSLALSGCRTTAAVGRNTAKKKNKYGLLIFGWIVLTPFVCIQVWCLVERGKYPLCSVTAFFV